MTAREMESALLTQCFGAAREGVHVAQNQREANVLRLAAMLVRSRFPKEAERLWQVSEAYFAEHPDERLAPVDVVKKGWVLSLPRLRDMLGQRLYGH